MKSPQALEIQNAYKAAKVSPDIRAEKVAAIKEQIKEFSRAHFTKCFKELGGYESCASEKTCYGFKPYALVSLDDFITNTTLTADHVDDHEAL